MLSLRVEKGEPVGVVFSLTPGETIIGRSSTARIRLVSPDISGAHAKISVNGDQAVLENLSRFGTRVNETAISGPAALTPGQRIAIGKSTVLVVESGREAVSSRSEPAALTVPATRGTAFGTATSAALKPVPDHEADTGNGITDKPGLAQDDKTGAALPQPKDGAEAEPLSRPDWTSEAGASGETRAMQTRAAAPDEIDFLKAAEQKKIRNRVTLGVVIAIPLLVLTIMVWPKAPPPETEFTWPKDATGEYLDAFEASPSGGFKDGGFDICYPGVPGVTKKSIPGGVVIEDRIGRDLNVPIKLILQEEKDKKFAGMDRAMFVSDWIQQMTASGGRWNFDKPTSAVTFIGKENGIPSMRVTYQRDGDGSWFGVATLYRYGIRRVTLRAEAPATERVRAERILSSRFIRPSIDYIRAYWEPVSRMPVASESDALRQIRQELDRMAPATWQEVKALLEGVLTKAMNEDNAEVEAEAVLLLSKLHERQALWFNSQQLAFDAAVMQGNTQKAKKIAEFAKGMFSDMEDSRYFTVRKWKVAP